MKKFLFVFNKNGGMVVAKYFNFPVLIKQILKEKGYDVYEEGVKEDYFCKDANGKDFIVNT